MGRTLDGANERVADVQERLKCASAATRAEFNNISVQIQENQTALVNIRSIGQQMMDLVRKFPLEMRDLLQRILQSNWQIYRLLLTLQQTPGPSPTGRLSSDIIFEDALGQVQELPYQYFRNWEVRSSKSYAAKSSLT